MPKGAVFLPWAGAFLMALAAGFAMHSWWAVRSFVRATGTVTENVASKAADGQTVYATHIRFRLPNGALVTAVDPVPSGENEDADFAAGAEVPLVYPAGDPHAAYIATRGRVYFVAIVLGVLGVAVFDFGLILLFTMRRKTQKRLDTAATI